MKKILIFTKNINNFKPFINYYENFIKDNYKLDLIISEPQEKNCIKKLFLKIKLHSKKYDLVVSDYFTWLFKNGKISLFMCHGYGTKKTPGNDEIMNKKNYYICKTIRKNVNAYITLSDFDSTYFYRWNDDEKLPIPKYVPLGIARNDILFNEGFRKSANEKFYNIFDKNKNTKYILYAPTWRGYETDYIFDREDFERINRILLKNNCILIIKQHPSEDFISSELFNNLSNIINGKKIKNLNTEEWLLNIDLLITDYSSIYVDYLLLNKPVAFITYDMEKYNSIRGLVIDKNKLSDMPGKQISTVEDLQNSILDLVNSDDKYIEYRRSAIKKFHKFKDGNSSERIWIYIIELLKNLK